MQISTKKVITHLKISAFLLICVVYALNYLTREGYRVQNKFNASLIEQNADYAKIHILTTHRYKDFDTSDQAEKETKSLYDAANSRLTDIAKTDLELRTMRYKIFGATIFMYFSIGYLVFMIWAAIRQLNKLNADGETG